MPSSDDLFPIQGPRITSLGWHPCSQTEAARAYAQNNDWQTDDSDAIFDHEGQRLCDSIEQLSEILISLGAVQELKGAYFPHYSQIEDQDKRAQAVREALS